MKNPLNLLGLPFLVIVVLGPGVVVSIAVHEAYWAILIPLATIAILLGIAALPIRRDVSPAQYADELERHLRGTDGVDEWDTTLCVRLKCARLEQLRRSLPPSFDDLRTEEDRISLQRIIQALRKGEFPDLTSRS